jgi:hypothetical protein
VDQLIGTVVGDRYRIVERLGTGGMAVVYRGEHQLLRKGVAVKVLLPEVAVDAEMAKRFEAEAVAAAKLDHPNCVAISDFGKTAGGQLYLVMELIDGRPLSTVVGGGERIEWQRAVDIARQILRGLARAHELGVVHRDLKPSNIMLVSRNGGWEIAKIIDFGIAKIIGESAVGPRVETKAGTVFGTADFIAPERLLGKSGDDARSDLYAVGVMLYEMVTGTRPFTAEDALTIVRKAITEPTPPPSQVAPDVKLPSKLEAAIMTALAKEPEHRFQSARDFLAALDAEELRTTANPVVAAASAALADAHQAEAARTRKKVLMWGGGGALVVLIVLAIALSTGGSEGDEKKALGAAGAAARPSEPIAGKQKPSDGGLAEPVAAEVDRLVKQAADGDTIESRQSAADRLVALGFGARVPTAAKLAKDLQQADPCPARLAVLEQIDNVNDPVDLPSVRTALSRPDNDCLKARGAEVAAKLARGHAAPTRSSGGGSKLPPKKSGGGGHF